MKCVPFEGQTAVLGAPPNWDQAKHGPCDGLPVKIENGSFVSTWEFTAGEIAKLYNGGKIKLKVYSNDGHPPVAIWVE
jgi:hypothetical protein